MLKSLAMTKKKLSVFKNKNKEKLRLVTFETSKKKDSENIFATVFFYKFYRKLTKVTLFFY